MTGMKVCNICRRITATGEDHTDCVQRRRIDLEDEDAKSGLPERLDMAKDPGDLAVEVRAILDHLAREKADSG